MTVPDPISHTDLKQFFRAPLSEADPAVAAMIDAERCASATGSN